MSVSYSIVYLAAVEKEINTDSASYWASIRNYRTCQMVLSCFHRQRRSSGCAAWLCLLVWKRRLWYMSFGYTCKYFGRSFPADSEIKPRQYMMQTLSCDIEIAAANKKCLKNKLLFKEKISTTTFNHFFTYFWRLYSLSVRRRLNFMSNFLNGCDCNERKSECKSWFAKQGDPPCFKNYYDTISHHFPHQLPA